MNIISDIMMKKMFHKFKYDTSVYTLITKIKNLTFNNYILYCNIFSNKNIFDMLIYDCIEYKSTSILLGGNLF